MEEAAAAVASDDPTRNVRERNSANPSLVYVRKCLRRYSKTAPGLAVITWTVDAHFRLPCLRSSCRHHRCRGRA